MKAIVDAIRADEEIQDMCKEIYEKTGAYPGFHPECHLGLDSYKEFLRREVKSLQEDKKIIYKNE